MNMTVESCGNAVVLNCKGDLTVDALAAFRSGVERQLSEHHVRDVLLNLQEVPFVDSSALEYLLDLQDRLEKGSGRLKLLHLDENVTKILEITRLDQRFECHDDLASAVKGL